MFQKALQDNHVFVGCSVLRCCQPPIDETLMLLIDAQNNIGISHINDEYFVPQLRPLPCWRQSCYASDCRHNEYY